MEVGVAIEKPCMGKNVGSELELSSLINPPFLI